MTLREMTDPVIPCINSEATMSDRSFKHLSRLTKCLRPRQPQHVSREAGQLDSACQQIGNCEVRSVNDSRPVSEQTEAERTGRETKTREKERVREREREEFV